MRSIGLRQLCLAGFFASFALAGCGSGHSGGGTGSATLSWYIFDIEDTTYATSLTCEEVGALQVSVTLTNQANASEVYTQRVACANWTTTIPSIPTGSYSATFALIGDPAIYGSGTDTVLDSFTATGTFHILAGVNDFTQTSYAPFVVQSFTVSWGVYSGSTQVSCATEGATYVYLDFLVPGTSTWVSSAFDCTANAGTSYAIPVPPPTVTTTQWTLSLVSAAGTDIQVLPGGTVTLPSSTNVNLAPQYFSF